MILYEGKFTDLSDLVESHDSFMFPLPEALLERSEMDSLLFNQIADADRTFRRR